MAGTYKQISLKFPTGNERYRQALECIEKRDTARFKTQVDYITTAILFFEGQRVDTDVMLAQIRQDVVELRKTTEFLVNEQRSKI